MIKLILPYDRSSLVHIPRRDLVLSAADSLTLRVTIVESDDPSAMVLYLTGGIGGPSIRLLIWADRDTSRWDYGAPFCSRRLLWASPGVIANSRGTAPAQTALTGSDGNTLTDSGGNQLFGSPSAPPPPLTQDAAGSFDIFIPSGAMACWPRRCAWAVQLDFDGDTQSQMLATGNLHLTWSAPAAFVPSFILTDGGDQVAGDDLTELEA